MNRRTFSCIQCGTSFDAYPPDDLHQDASRNPEELEEEPIKIEYKCKNPDCKTINILYWGQVKVDGSLGF